MESSPSPAPSAPFPASFDAMPRKKRDRFHQVIQILHEQQQNPDPEKRFVTAPQLAKKFGCGLSTIYRLMDALRDDHKLPIEPLPGRGGYRFYEPVSSLPTVIMSELETVALCVSVGSMSMFEGTIFSKPARTLSEKISAGLCDRLALTFDAVSNAVSFHCTGAESHIDPATFSTVLPTLVNHQELEIEYAKGPSATLSSSFSLSSSSSPSADGSSPSLAPSVFALDGRRDSVPGLRRVEPLHLACIDYGWYLFAWDPAQNDIRNFALRRIRSIRTTGVTCAPRPFEIASELKASFGAYRSALKDAETIRLRFWGAAAQIVPEFIWHRSQKFTTLSNPSPDQPGAIEMTMEVARNPKLVGWVKQWLGEVAVIEPVKLRDLVRAAAIKGAADQDAVAAYAPR